MERKKINTGRGARLLLDIMERRDKEEYERIVGPGVKSLTDDDLVYLRNLATEELANRYPQGYAQPVRTGKLRDMIREYQQHLTKRNPQNRL